MEYYEETLGDTEVSLDLNSNDVDVYDNNYSAAIKCIFSKPKTIKGAFCILLRKHDLKVIELVLWTTKNSPNEEYEVNPIMPWEDFSTKISSIGPIDKESCEKLQIAIKEKLTKEVLEFIFDDPKSNVTAFSSELRELIEINLRYLIKLELEFEPFSQKRLKDSGYERDIAPSNTNTDGVKMSQIIAEQIDTQVVNCTVIVDPVNGIPASRLQKGDLVEVAIQTNSTVGALLADHYAKLHKMPEFPVKEVSISENGSYIINLEADGNIHCVTKISSDLRLRAKKSAFYESSLSKRSIIIVFGVAATAFVLMVALVRLLLR